MNYQILVNKTNPLTKNYLPKNLVSTNSQYKENILINKKVYEAFKKMQYAAKKYGYELDIMSGYRDYYYQETIYNKSLKEKGYAYTFRSVAKPGTSEHQTGLAIDICFYRDEHCYIEHELENTPELTWLINNSYKYGFIMRYPKNKDDVTGYNYEPWHYRYIGSLANFLTKKELTMEEYFKKLNLNTHKK